MSSEASGGELLTTVAEGLLTSLGVSPLALETARSLLGEADLDEEGARQRLREIVEGDGSCGSCGEAAAGGSCGNCGWVAEADTAAETVAVLGKPKKRRRRGKKAKVDESKLEEYAVVNGTPTPWGGVTPAVAADNSPYTGDADDVPAIASSPPNLRESDSWESCGNCVFYGKGQCNLYGLGRAAGKPDIVHRGGWPVDEDDLCDSHSTLTPQAQRVEEAQAALKEAVASGSGDRVARARARLAKLEEWDYGRALADAGGRGIRPLDASVLKAGGVKPPSLLGKWTAAKHPRARGGEFAQTAGALKKLRPGQSHNVALGVDVRNDQQHGYSVLHHGEVLSRHGNDAAAAAEYAHRVAARAQAVRDMPTAQRRARRDAQLGLAHADGGAARIRPQLEEVKSDVYPGLDRSPKENWVDKAGGLPRYIERIAKHLHYEKGKPVGTAIAIAVNVVKRMCASGDTNFPGKQSVNPKSRAEACAAVADWEKKKGSAAAKRAGKELSHSLEGLDFASALALAEADYRPIPPSINYVRKLHDEIARKDGPGWMLGYALLDEADALQAANPDGEVYYDVAEARLDIRAPKLSPGKWNPLKHPRAAKGRKGGGEFASVLGHLARAAGHAPARATVPGARDNEPTTDDHKAFVDQMNGRKGTTGQAHLPGMTLPERRPPLGRLNRPAAEWGEDLHPEQGPQAVRGRKGSINDLKREAQARADRSDATHYVYANQQGENWIGLERLSQDKIVSVHEPRKGRRNQAAAAGDQGALAIDHAIGSVLQTHGEDLADWHVSGPKSVGGKKRWVLDIELKSGGKHTIHVGENGEVEHAGDPPDEVGHAAHMAAAQKGATASIHQLVPTGVTEKPYHMADGTFFQGKDGLVYEKIESGPHLMMGKKGPLAAVRIKNHSHGTEKVAPAFALSTYYDILAPAGQGGPVKPTPGGQEEGDVFELLKKSVEKSGGNGSVGSLSGKNVVVTGKIPGHTREQFHAKLAAAGAHPQSSVTKTTDYLITGENVGKTKTNAAVAKGVKVVPHHSVLHLLEVAVDDHARLVAVAIALEEAEDTGDVVRLRARRAALVGRLEERDFSAGKRRSLAAKGQALGDGSYPIPDEDALRRAEVLAKSGHGDAVAAKRLIRKRAKQLGVSTTV